VRDFTVEDFETLFWFQLNYPSELGGNFPATYRDIVFERFTVRRVKTFFEARAFAAAPLADVTLRDIAVAEAATPFVLEHVRNLKLENVRLGAQRLDRTLNAGTLA
jgi:hypothetical protein